MLRECTEDKCLLLLRLNTIQNADFFKFLNKILQRLRVKV